MTTTTTPNENASERESGEAKKSPEQTGSFNKEPTGSADKSQERAQKFPQPNHLAFNPKNGSVAYVEITKVAGTKKALDSIDAKWRGGKRDEITGEWEYPDRLYRSIKKESGKQDVLSILERSGTQQE